MIVTRGRAYGPYRIIEIEGRIDGLTSSTLNQAFEQLADEGNHKLVIDFSAVSYISSTGLRVFLQAQKKLKSVGGEIVLLSMHESAKNVFRVSGLHNLFSIISGLEELGDVLTTTVPGNNDSKKLFVSDDGVFQWELRDVPEGRYSGIGNQAKLRNSVYTGKDIVTLSQAELQFALGLATVGESLQDYRDLFGEALLIDHHFLGYPAVELSAVDYTYLSETHPGRVHFLHGLKFTGDFRVLLRYDSAAPVDLLSIARKSAEISGKQFFGLVMVGKSAGIYGLNLRKIPWQENAPDPPDIMVESNLPGWFDFPVEDTDINKTIIAAGIYTGGEGNEELHMHAVVFSKGLISKSGMDLHAEIERILHRSEPLRVVHLLEESRFFNGIAGIVTF